MEISFTTQGTILLIPHDGCRAENVYFIGPYTVEFFPVVDAVVEIKLAPNVYILSYEYRNAFIREKHNYTLVVLPIDVQHLPENLKKMAAQLDDESIDVDTLRKLYNKFIKEYDNYRKQ